MAKLETDFSEYTGEHVFYVHVLIGQQQMRQEKEYY